MAHLPRRPDATTRTARRARHHLEDQRQRRLRSRLLAAAGARFGASVDLEETLGNIAALAVESFADLCAVGTIGEGAAPDRRRVSVSDRVRPASGASAIDDAALTALDRITSEHAAPVLRQRLPDDVGDLAPNDRELLAALGARSLIALPLDARGRRVGSLLLIATGDRAPYRDDDLACATELAAIAALALDTARVVAEARQAVAERDRMMSIVAHDLRGPLATISLNAQRLERSGEPRAERMGGMFGRAVHQMDRLIADLLDVARIDSGRLTVRASALRPEALASEAFQLAVDRHPDRDLRLEVAHRLPRVAADRDRVLQVLGNLIGNAVKFTPAGRPVTVGVRRRLRDVELFVRDEGVGIAPEAIGRVFDRFWQANGGDGRGVGLGLSIAKAIVEQHGGAIRAESEPGRGTLVAFTLPVASRREIPRAEVDVHA
jgi:signal transduction histidine kinase